MSRGLGVRGQGSGASGVVRRRGGEEPRARNEEEARRNAQSERIRRPSLLAAGGRAFKISDKLLPRSCQYPAISGPQLAPAHSAAGRQPN